MEHKYKFMFVLIVIFSFICMPKFVYAEEKGQTVYDFEYNGEKQEWTAPTDGTYLFEVWGAQGGYRGGDNSGHGGYTKGYVYAKKGDHFFVYVGGDGNNHKGFNGGGSRGVWNQYGGGATDIRFDTDSLYSRIIVAGGGGTDGADGYCGGAGGLNGGGTCGGYGSGGGGASISGAGGLRGEFGKGGDGANWAGGYGGAGGGGWYGGGGADPDGSGDDDKGGGGGSSFVWNEGTTSNVPNGYTVPTRLQMTDFSYSSGVQSGDGKARITTISPDGIDSIKLNSGKVNINYDKDIYSYTITVDNNVSSVNFNVTPKEGYVISYSQKNLDVSSNTGTETITVTHIATGLTRVYTVTINQVNHYLVQDGNSVYYDIPYTGQYQEFYIPSTGTWTVEAWGAEGANRGPAGGKGGYTVADVDFSQGDKLYLYVGGAGTTVYNGREKGWNGGGHCYYYYTNGGFYTAPTNVYGGGSSDVRIGGNTLNNRILVAGGGAGAGARGVGGAGNGGAGSGGCGSGGQPGTLTAGGYANGTWLTGGNEILYAGGYGGPGGGGWYGGGHASPDGSGDDDSGGGGGSGWIWSEANSSSAPSDYAVSSKYYMTNGFIHGGWETFKNPAGGNEVGQSGNGYIRLTPKLLNGINTISINGGDIPIDFDYTKHDYILTIPETTKSIRVNVAINAGYSLSESHTGDYDISSSDLKEYVYTFTVTNNITGVENKYTITFHKPSYYWQKDTTGSYGFTCTHDVQYFVAPASGIYTIEAWGAQGGNRGPAGGNGSYASGKTFLSAGQTIYLYVGCNGSTGQGWNGGGKPYSYRDGNQNLVIPVNIYGGGASDVRIGGTSLYNRILVAGGGGAAGARGTGGPGDSIGNGAGCGNPGNPGTMSGAGDGGSFGYGANAFTTAGTYISAGGGGWYGGGYNYPDYSGDDDDGAGGGSSYVWCSAYSQYAPEGYEVSKLHYMTDPIIINGYSAMPTHDGTSTMTGNAGDGYIRINFTLSYKYKINVSDNVTLDHEFDYDTKSYNGTVDKTSSIVEFSVDTTDDESVLKYSGDGKHEIHVGDNAYPVSITYVNGAIDVFTYNINREANDIDSLNDLKIDGKSFSSYGGTDFSSGNYNYSANLPYTGDEYDLNIDKGSADQKIEIYEKDNPDKLFNVETDHAVSKAHVKVKKNDYYLVVKVTNELNTSTKTYTIHVTYPHSSKLKKITLTSGSGKAFDYKMEDGKTFYNIELESYIAAATLIPEFYDGEATAKVEGDGYIRNDHYTITVKVHEPHVDDTLYVFNVTRISIAGYEEVASYNGSCTTWVAPYDHVYLLEAWGAQGGRNGGLGGYSKGSVYLAKGTKLYLCPGGSGDNGGFNGGGTSLAGYGGGASDIRYDQNTLYNRILIAGGGGGHGSDGCAAGGAGGGLNGVGRTGQGSCGTSAGGATQTSGGVYGIYGSHRGANGKFAYGANASNSGGGYYGGGGGGGFYGGGSGATGGWSSGGGGGSGFVFTKDTYSLVTDDFSDDFSGNRWLVPKDYELTDASTLAGTQQFSTVNGKGVETGHAGDGYVKVSIPYQPSENDYLAGIVSDKGTITPENWDYNTFEYDLQLESKDTHVNLEGVPASDTASVAGNGNYIFEAGDTDVTFTVTSEAGSVRVYTLHVHRPVDHNPYPNTIAVDGMLSVYCNNNEYDVNGDYCKYIFDKETGEYNITVPYQIRQINLTVDKAHYFQNVTGDGIYDLDRGLNKKEVVVTAEDKVNKSSYKYNITRDMTGDADLKSLKITNPETDLNYSYDVTDYYVSVSNSTSKIDVEAIPDDIAATVNIDNTEELSYDGFNDVVVTVTAQNGKQKKYTIHVTRLKSDNAFLSALTVTNITGDSAIVEDLTPSFSKGVTSYTVKVDNDVKKVRIGASVENTEFATLTGDGEYDLNVGSNIHNIVVTAQDGSNLTYTVNIMRAANSNAFLSDLKVKNNEDNYLNLTETFDKNKFEYYIYTGADSKIITVEATPEVETTHYGIASGSTTLSAGKNIIVVRATAEDGSYNDYVLYIVRTAYNDNNLLSLKVNRGQESYILTPAFNPEYDDYTLNVGVDETDLQLVAISNAEHRSYINGSSSYVENINMLDTNPFKRSIVVTAEDGSTHTYNITINRTKSDDATLSVLEVNGLELNPAYNKDTSEYTLPDTDKHSLSITAVPTSKYSTVSISKTDLDVGSNTINITVTAETGTQKVYTISVNRHLSTDNTLSSLNVSTGINPKFSSDVTEYTSSTHSSVVTITPLVNQEYASYKITDNDGNVLSDNSLLVSNLNVGDNIFKVVVTAEDKSTKTYTINVTRILNKNPNLSSITVNGGELEPLFDKDTTTYEVNTSAHSISLSATVEDSEYARYDILDSNGTIVTGSHDFIKGQSEDITYIIRGYAEDRNVTKDYTINIHRTPSNNALIKNLNYTYYSVIPNFDPNQFVYATTTDETYLDLSNMELQDSWASYDIENNSDFVNNETKTVTITVTAEDGESEQEYSIDVTKVINTDPRLKELSFTNYDLSPSFDSATKNYTIYVENSLDKLTMHAKTLMDTAKISSIKVNDTETISDAVREFNGDITIPLYSKDSTRKIVITTLSEDGTTTDTYNVNVETIDYTNNNLASLQITYNNNGTIKSGMYSPIFDKDTLSYDIGFPDGTKSFTIAAIPESVNSTVVNGNTTFTYAIGESYKKVEIVVTAKNGSQKTYVVNASRKLSSESRLKSLSFVSSELTFPKFDKDVFSYDINVPTDVKTLTLDDFSYTKMDEAAYVTMPACNLKQLSTNKCSIYVTAENGNVSEYVLNITRAKGTESRLKSLTFGDYKYDSGEFDPDTKVYTLRVPKTKTTLGRSDLSYELMDPESTVSFPSDTQLNFESNDNSYIITVTAADGVSTSTYLINVQHILDTDNRIASYTIDGVSYDITDADNNVVSPTITYGIFDDETSANLESITLKRDTAYYSTELPITMQLGKKYTIPVTAENGDVKTYTFEVKQTKTRDLGLDGIKVSIANSFDCDGICTLDKTFSSDNLEYNYTVPFGVEHLNIEVTTKNKFQNYDILNNENFKTGVNDVTIRVHNSLGETRDYIIHVTREPSHDANLKKISFKTPEKDLDNYNENTYEYSTEFSNLESGKYTLDIEKKDEGESYSLDGAQVLYYGQNNIIVHTYSETCFSETKSRYGCEEKDYLIHAYRFMNYSNLLNSITISSGDSGNLLQDFSKYKFDYVLNVPSEVSKVKIDSIPSASDGNGKFFATVDGNGDYNLNVGVNTINLVVKPNDEGESRTYTINIIRSTSDNVNLENLYVTGKVLTPTFDKKVTDYYLTVDADTTSIPIVYVPESSDSTVYVNGNSNFVTGENIVSIIVISADKTRGKTYKIHVTKEPSKNNYLSSLTATSVKDGETITDTITPTFDKDKNSYSVSLDKYINNITFHVQTESGFASVSGASTYSVDYGTTSIPITVTAENGDTKVYTVTVNRDYNLNLSSLHVNTVTEYESADLMDSFDKDKTEYYINVSNDIDKVDITGTLEEDADTVTGFEMYDLKTGNNDILITVKYDDPSKESSEDPTKVYIIHISRDKSNVSTLENLEVEEGVLSPEFSKDNTKYSVSIPYEFTKVTPKYTFTDDKTERAEVLNNDTELEVGVPKDVTVRVYAEDETYTDYVITVTRTDRPKSSNYLKNMYIEDYDFDQAFSSANLNYSVTVDASQSRVVLHVLPESSYASISVYNLNDPGSSVNLNSKLSDPQTLLSLANGRNTFIVRVSNDEGLVRNYKIDIYKSGSSDARIKSLKFDHGTIAPSFDKNNFTYNISVDNTVKKLKISEITMVNPDTTYKITGNLKLKTGDNTVLITTTAADGTTHLEYTFNVTRKKSDNAYLSNIYTFPEHDEDEWNFDKSTYQYTLYVDQDTQKVQVLGVREDTSSKLTGNGVYTLDSDMKTVKLVVTSESGLVTRTYTVNIVRRKDSNNYLKSLTTNNGTLVPSFDKTVNDYTVTVENSVDMISLTGVAESQYAIVSGNVKNTALNVGNNKFSITVTAQNGTTNSYNINVVRLDDEASKLQLDDLQVVEGELTPKFAPAIKGYVVSIPYEYTNATFIYKTHDATAEVKIAGNENFVVGHNSVQIEVLLNGVVGDIYNVDVIRQEKSDNYLSDLSVQGQTISPAFDKSVQSYTLTVPNSVAKVDIKAAKEVENSTLKFKNGDGDYVDTTGYESVNLAYRDNYFYFKVISNTNAERVYRLKITRQVSDDNKLLTLIPSSGTVTPSFDPDVNEYTINVPTGTKTIKLTGTYSQGATQKGLDVINNISVGTFTKLVTITSQSGIVNTYKFKIVREASHNANITNVVPDRGSLTPSFDPNTKEYSMTVEGEVSTINYNVTTEDPNATVIGNRNVSLSPGNNIVYITATAEDGLNTDTIKINVYRKIDIKGISVSSELIIPLRDSTNDDNDYQVDVTYLPENTDYKELSYSSSDSSIFTVSSDGKIKTIALGEANLTITSTRNSNITKTIKVTVILPEIASDVYYIDNDTNGNTDSKEYIAGFDAGTTISEFLSNIKDYAQYKDYMHVYSASGDLLSDDDVVATKQVIKLEMSGKVYDQLTLVLMGDINGDGRVVVSDVNKIRNDILGKVNLDTYEELAADVNCDDRIVVSDVNKVRNYILGKISSLGTDVLKKKTAQDASS